MWHGHLGLELLEQRPLRPQRVAPAGGAFEPLGGLAQLLLREVRLHLERKREGLAAEPFIVKELAVSPLAAASRTPALRRHVLQPRLGRPRYHWVSCPRTGRVKSMKRESKPPSNHSPS